MEYWVLFLAMAAFGLILIFPVAPRKLWMRWVWVWMTAALTTIASFVHSGVPRFWVWFVGVCVIPFAVIIIRSAWKRFFDYLAGTYP